MKKIKVFTVGHGPKTAGDELTTLIETWQNTPPAGKLYVIDDMHTNSNKYGWMVTITYQIISEPR